MKGGSVASNAVSGLVTDPAYNLLTKNFSNSINAANAANAAKCGGGCACKSAKCGKKCSCNKGGYKSACGSAKCGKTCSCNKKGGNDVFSSVSNAVTKAMSSSFNKQPTEGFNVFRSNTAPSGYDYAHLRGAKGGNFTAKNMSEYMTNTNSYKLQNRKGGAVDNPTQIVKGLDYSAIQSTNRMHGDVVSRATPEAVNILLSSQNASALPAMNKQIVFGSVSSPGSPFSYSSTNHFSETPLARAGGASKKTKKPVAAKKPAAKKTAAKKPAAKKAAPKK